MSASEFERGRPDLVFLEGVWRIPESIFEC